MPKAFVKVWTDAGKETAVCAALRKTTAVKSAELTAGDQDIIAVVQAKSYEALLKLVVSKIRKIKGVARTVTNLILE